jgi:DNA-directed RNA polymerase specialized sigma24 family protein
MDTGEETLRLLATLVRQMSATQADAIAELSKAGFGPTRIAELLGTTTGTAKMAVRRSRAKGSTS